MEKTWLRKYPAGVPDEINADSYRSLVELLDEAIGKFGNRPAFESMGTGLTFSELDALADDFATFLQHTAGLGKGDRLAVQLPNVLQYPVVLVGALRAGVVVVNTNPLYSLRELEHQYGDSGAKALVVIANEAHKIDRIIDKTDIDTVIVTAVGDLLGRPKRWLVNAMLKYVRRMVPPWSLEGAWTLDRALKAGAAVTPMRPDLGADDMAFLQYTGGTTGCPRVRYSRTATSLPMCCRYLPG